MRNTKFSDVRFTTKTRSSKSLITVPHGTSAVSCLSRFYGVEIDKSETRYSLGARSIE